MTAQEDAQEAYLKKHLAKTEVLLSAERASLANRNSKNTKHPAKPSIRAQVKSFMKSFIR